MVGRIARAVDVPVSADLEAGYGDPGETIRRAIGEGVVGANLEDQLKPLDESVAAVEAAVAAAEAEGVPFVLNARTDAWARGRNRPREVCIADAIERGRAYPRRRRDLRLRAGQLRRRRSSSSSSTGSAIAGEPHRCPGLPAPARLQELGVARVSYGPVPQRVALGALQDLATTCTRGRAAPRHPPLN